MFLKTYILQCNCLVECQILKGFIGLRIMEKCNFSPTATYLCLRVIFKKKWKLNSCGWEDDPQSDRLMLVLIWFWVYWLAKHAPKSVKYQFTKLGRLTAKRLWGRSKNYFEFLFCNLKASFQKIKKSTMSRSKRSKMFYIWLWVHSLPENAPTSAKYHFTNFGRLTARDTSERVKTILQLLFLTQRPILRKIQGGLSNREKLCEYLLFDSAIIFIIFWDLFMFY